MKPKEMKLGSAVFFMLHIRAAFLFLKADIQYGNSKELSINADITQ